MIMQHQLLMWFDYEVNDFCVDLEACLAHPLVESAIYGQVRQI